MIVVEHTGLKQIDSALLCEYILAQHGPMSHLKLQKLLYYVQAYHLAYFDKPIVDDTFEAWVHGPVSRKIWNLLKGASVLYGTLRHQPEPGKLTPAQQLQTALFPAQLEWIDEILKEFAQLRDLELEAATHAEAPWQEARKGFGPADSCSVAINPATMQQYYKQFLV